MVSEGKNAKWEELLAVRAEFDGEDVLVPMLRSRIDGTPRPPSQEALRLARALAISDSWSRISDARSRLAA
jgi:hypothetical protein